MSGFMEPGSIVVPSERRVWMGRVAIWVGLALVLVGLGLGLKSLFSGKVSTKKPVTTIKILPDTPPPPPPPPPKEPPKEQPRDQPKEIKVEQPKPQEAPQPPAESLKMEGAAGDGPSPFAAGPVANDYKGGDVGTKIGGKKGMAAFAWFTGKIDSHIKKALAGQKELAKAKYRVEVRIWLALDGAIERAELLGSSGNEDTDALISKVLANLPAIGDTPPEDMPRKVVLSITSENVN